MVIAILSARPPSTLVAICSKPRSSSAPTVKSRDVV
jgi:hypothetical protein